MFRKLWVDMSATENMRTESPKAATVVLRASRHRDWVIASGLATLVELALAAPAAREWSGPAARSTSVEAASVEMAELVIYLFLSAVYGAIFVGVVSAGILGPPVALG